MHERGQRAHQLRACRVSFCPAGVLCWGIVSAVTVNLPVRPTGVGLLLVTSAQASRWTAPKWQGTFSRARPDLANARRMADYRATSVKAPCAVPQRPWHVADILRAAAAAKPGSWFTAATG
ncbi:hypothetical protein ON010_g18293 [Phytophthora cinnamomi]|nr:hypothetical protein ON010_g18293 [Phytophthora cinnamomi]